MKTSISNYLLISLFVAFTFQACKPKKIVQKAAPAAETEKPAAAAKPEPKPVVETKPATTSAIPSIDINNVKIQFEFDSSVLRTDSYPVLDQVAAEIKMNPNVSYLLNGYASIEGTKEHNLRLSADRANAVKTYLVNAGVNASSLKTKGFGTRNPVGSNATEAGRALNRRVEIKANHS